MPVRKSHLEIVRCVGKTSPCAWARPSLLETEARNYGHSSRSGVSVYVCRFPQPATSRIVRDPLRRRFRSAGDVSGGASNNYNNASKGSIDWRVASHVISTVLRRKEISLGTRDPKLLHPEVKRRPLDSQTCSRS